jgi:hypothetical protein
MTIVLAIFLAVLPGWAANADQSKQRTTKPPAKARSVDRNPCAQYGPGFVKIQGSDTCIKIGGSVGVDAGGRR